MTQQEVIEKIGKLLRLSKSANPHEAALALERAMDMAQKHNLEIADINTDQPPKISDRCYPKRRIMRDVHCALLLVKNFFCVDATVQSGCSYRLIGTATDIAIAEYVIEYAVTQCRRHAAGYGRGGAKRANFIDGFFAGIALKLRDFCRVAGIDLDRNSDAIKKYHAQAEYEILGVHERGKKPRANIASMAAGYVAGMRTAIRPGMGGNNRPSRILAGAPA